MLFYAISEFRLKPWKILPKSADNDFFNFFFLFFPVPQQRAYKDVHFFVHAIFNFKRINVVVETAYVKFEKKKKLVHNTPPIRR